MALARPATPTIGHQPAAQPHRPAPFSPADFAAESGISAAPPTSHIRRCTYRRVMPLPATRRGQLPMYEVDCTHPSYESPVALGGLAMARDACASCTLPGTFRPDED